MLSTTDLTKKFGGFVALDGVDFNINNNETKSLIGPNGAGKTTFFNVVSGALSPSEGKVELRNEDITGLETYQLVRQGMARSFQISNLLNELTVMENLRLGLQRGDLEALSPSFAFSRINNDSELKNAAYDLATRVGLEGVADQKVSELPHGQKRRIEIGLTLSTGADLLLFDEPAAGLTTKETRELISLIDEIGENKTILLVEHDMELVMDVSDRISVLHQGQLIADGPPEKIQNDPNVQDVYLGGE
jgi:branched-chain amino acid transport system ATP-binding protein